MCCLLWGEKKGRVGGSARELCRPDVNINGRNHITPCVIDPCSVLTLYPTDGTVYHAPHPRRRETSSPRAASTLALRPSRRVSIKPADPITVMTPASAPA